jgi:TrmH family RNA methyltransferase
MIDIESKQNAKFKKWQSLLQAKGIKAEGQAILSGEKLIKEYLEQTPDGAREQLFPPKAKPGPGPAHLKNYRLPKALFDELDVIGTHTPLLIVEAPAFPKYSGGNPRGLELVVALSDPGNMGAVLRSAEAFGTSKVILAQESCSPFLPKAIRASSGACFRLKMESAGPLAQFAGTPSFCLDMRGTELSCFKPPKDFFLILGEEGRGVPDSLNAKRLKISMTGGSESLNAVVAASIALYALKSEG